MAQQCEYNIWNPAATVQQLIVYYKPFSLRQYRWRHGELLRLRTAADTSNRRISLHIFFVHFFIFSEFKMFSAAENFSVERFFISLSFVACISCYY